jgi:hypothetical protein
MLSVVSGSIVGAHEVATRKVTRSRFDERDKGLL